MHKPFAERESESGFAPSHSLFLRASPCLVLRGGSSWRRFWRLCLRGKTGFCNRVAGGEVALQHEAMLSAPASRIVVGALRNDSPRSR
jgi:hypothetical protein